ncbi:uncharacterized protein LOC141726381 isoform X1 [Zonotrichia albicollis]|uniref:uncharacterized protein LOC141726381 isoform X1 n=1 Tax=Zonotrichia albicollis TaxID=44394 RepID=UPI003D810A3A
MLCSGCCGSVGRSAARRSGSGAGAAWSPRCSGGKSRSGMAARTVPGTAPPAAASAGLGSRRSRMIEVRIGPGPDRHRYSAAARPAGRPLADTAPPLSPAGTPIPARQHRGHRAPLYRDTALPCESHSARIPLLRVSILGGSSPNDQDWGCCSRCGCTWCGPGGGQKPPKGWQPSRPRDLQEELCLQRAEHTSRCGYRDSAGTDTAKALPAAPQPGAALKRHTEMPQPGQTPPTAQKDPKEQLALPGMEAQTVCRGAQTAVPVSDLPELPDIESQSVYFGDASKSEVQAG